MSNPIRMCICCRKKIPQNLLMRLQCIDKTLVHFTKSGRSFYLCETCVKSKDKRLQRSLSSRCKKNIKITDLESLIYG
ncbi:MAG TPA: DUF448 domain-containing protein [Campylobacterales bacterium]|nr:DUF448 domain-containing protein [Campylobacterales bacterium]